MATQNNGQQGWTTLEQYYLNDGTATGVEKPNNIGDPDYVSPITNLTACPLPLVQVRTAHDLGSSPHSTMQTIIKINTVEVYRGTGSVTIPAAHGDVVNFQFISNPTELPWSPDCGVKIEIDVDGVDSYNSDITIQNPVLATHELTISSSQYDVFLNVSPLVVGSDWKIRELHIENPNNLNLIAFKLNQNPSDRLLANLSIINGIYNIYINSLDSPNFLIDITNDNARSVQMIISKTSDGTEYYNNVLTSGQTVTDIAIPVGNITYKAI